MKQCSECYQWKSLDEFHVARMGKRGHPIYTGACCACRAERCRKWRKTKGETLEASRRRDQRRRQTMTPEQAAEIRDKNREYWRRKHNVPPERFRRSMYMRDSGATGDRERVPAGPFVDWLNHIKRREGVGNTTLARLLGTNERAVSRYLTGESKMADLSVVEAAITHEGSTTLIELYPSLYGGCIQRNDQVASTE